MLHVVPDVWGTLLVHGLRFALRRHTRNSVKERDTHTRNLDNKKHKIIQIFLLKQWKTHLKLPCHELKSYINSKPGETKGTCLRQTI